MPELWTVSPGFNVSRTMRQCTPCDFCNSLLGGAQFPSSSALCPATIAIEVGRRLREKAFQAFHPIAIHNHLPIPLYAVHR
jgi:hypothetical protein